MFHVFRYNENFRDLVLYIIIIVHVYVIISETPLGVNFRDLVNP